MKAVVLTQEKQLPEFIDIDHPVIQEDEVIVALKASALNHRDVWITKGMYPGIKTPCVMGSDGVGTYDGKDYIINPGLYWGEDERFQADDFQVLGMPKDGTFAEAIAIEKKYLYEVPHHLDVYEAAALPLAGLTAYRTLFTRCQVKPSDTVLISGVGGGVAQFALQYAAAIGCDVWVTSGSDDKIEQAVRLGAKGGVNYKGGDWYKELLKLSGGIDVVIDSAGGDGFQHFVKLCNPGGRIGFYGASLGKYNNLNPQLLFWRQISILGSTMGSDKDFKDMLDLVSKYKIKPVVDSVINLSDAVEGFKKMDSGDQFGKIVFNHTS